MKTLVVTYTVDDEDEDLLALAHPILNVSLRNRTVGIQRLIAERMGISAAVIDHKNRNSADNTRKNLRGATHAQNVHNSKKQRNNTSGYIGVSWDKKAGKWKAKIMQNGKRKWLGYYADPVDAALAYDNEAKERGEFSVLNFPEYSTT